MQDKYVPRCLDIVKDRECAEDEFLDNVKTSDFKRFFRAALKLSLHMVLNDPPILMSLAPWSIRRDKVHQEERFDYWMYNKNDYYCIDGFP